MEQLDEDTHPVKMLTIGDCLPILMAAPSVVLGSFHPKPLVAWMEDTDRVVHQAHLGKVGPRTLIHPIVTVDVMVPLAPTPCHLNDLQLGNHHHNDHEDLTVPNIRILAAAVHLSLAVIPTFWRSNLSQTRKTVPSSRRMMDISNGKRIFALRFTDTDSRLY